MNRLLLVGFAIANFSNAQALELDTSHSSLQFEVKHLMISTVSGNFTDFKATLTGDGKDLTKAGVDFTVNVSSINTANTKRDDHLRNPDFFEVEKFPEAKFKSTKITRAGSNKYKLAGDLTIKGVTKPVTFDLFDLGKQKDMQGNLKRGFSATTKIKRKDWGLTWNKALDGGGVVVSDDVRLKLDLQVKE